jgi:hypothetical protein
VRPRHHAGVGEHEPRQASAREIAVPCLVRLTSPSDSRAKRPTGGQAHPVENRDPRGPSSRVCATRYRGIANPNEAAFAA